MRAPSIAFLLLCAAAAPLARADVEVIFAVPEEGRISLGVFDSSGRLVRRLHALTPEQDFRAGLNGLITSWDGKNDAGKPLPPGRYHIRGYLISNGVSVAREDVRRNDFADDPGFPGLSRILSFCLLENGDVLLLGRSADLQPLLARFSPGAGFLWTNQAPLAPEPPDAPRLLLSAKRFEQPAPVLGGSVIVTPRPQPLPSFAPLLAASRLSALLIDPALSGTFSLESGARIHGTTTFGGMTPLAAAASDSAWFVSARSSLTTIPIGLGATPPSHEQVSIPPAAFTALDADATTLIGATEDGVWIRRESWAKWPGPVGAASLSLGTPGTFWLVESDSSVIAQATFEGEVLRSMEPAPGDPLPQQIRASRSADSFLVLEASPSAQRLRAMSRSAAGQWEIDWERTLRSSPGAPDSKPLQETRVLLKENPLSGRRDFLLVCAGLDASGSGLFSPDGLPLVAVSSRNDLQRAAIHRGPTPDTIRFLQGNETSAEGFTIQGLSEILPIDAGSIDLP